MAAESDVLEQGTAPVGAQPNGAVPASPEEAATRKERSSLTRSQLRERLAAAIKDNGEEREARRHALESANCHNEEDAQLGMDGFSADLVLREESGFELWLGSLDDALKLEALREQRINAFVNCAIEDCRRECAVFKSEPSPSHGARRRTHARGQSLHQESEAGAQGRRTLHTDVVRGLVDFEAPGPWYSDILGYDIAYLGVPGADENGYPMDRHLTQICPFLLQCRQEGRKVLVHCVWGINRSSFSLVAFLCNNLGMALSDAVDLASKNRGYILSNESFLEQLVEKFGPSEAF